MFDRAGHPLAFAVLLVVAWELPLMLRVAGNVLARSDRSREQAALTLGADPVTTLRRGAAPALSPAALSLLCPRVTAPGAPRRARVLLARPRRPPRRSLPLAPAP